jgi:hypothetical protein
MKHHDCKQSVADKTGPIILAALKKYLEEIINHGHNGVHVPPELNSNIDGGLVSDKEAFNKWVGVINRMIYAFEDHISVEEFEQIWESDVSGNIVISDKARFRRFEQAQIEHEAKVRAGMKLFAKHYEYL